MATHKRSLRNRDISIPVIPPAPQRSKPVSSITTAVVPSKRQALVTPQAQKRQREQMPPTQQTNMDLASLDDDEEEEEPLLRRSYKSSSSVISPSTLDRTVLQPPSPLAIPPNDTLSAPLQSMSSTIRLSSPSAPNQQRSNIPSQQKRQAHQFAQHIQEPLDQQQSDTSSSRRHPLGALSPKEVAARSWQPNTSNPPEMPSNHYKGKGKATFTRRRRRFFDWQPAHKALIDWMTTDDNLARAGSKDLAGPQGISGVYEEAAEHVRKTLPNRPKFGVKRVHTASQETNSTGSGTYDGMTIDEQREAICPGYKDLWPVVRALSDTKFAERTKSSLPSIPLCPKPLAPLSHTSFTPQSHPSDVAAIDADTGNIESEERTSVSGPSITSPKAVDLSADANAMANKLFAVLDKCDAEGERQSDARLKDAALYLYKDQRERVGQLEKKVEVLLEKDDALREKNDALRESNCELRIEIQRLKSECAVANK
ncbi:hypothetical protein BKA57DRAFT_434502 [Linnemannia elongata]|nr:hypothetical protein BKA57DRAFT_434502 [Linnemannia elongata]